METQYSGYRIDLCFHDHKLATEIDENGHSDRNIDFEIKKTLSNRTRNILLKNIAWLWIKSSDFAKTYTVINIFVTIYLFPCIKKLFVTLYQCCKYVYSVPPNILHIKTIETYCVSCKKSPLQTKILVLEKLN